MVKITSCNYIGRQQTYDLEIDHPDHQFYLSNGLLTSNSHSHSYSFNSYHCAYLFTYHEQEWIQSCLEKDADLQKTINVVRSLGYNVIKPDINKSMVSEWSIQDKVCTPALTSLKGIGLTAAEDVTNHRPKDGYKTIQEFLFDGEEWRLKKFNKKSFDVLIKMEGFNSIPNLIGPECLFKNYKHFHNVMLGDTSKLSKVKKGKYVIHHNLDLLKDKKITLEELALNTETTDWTTEEKIAFQREIAGFYDKGLIVGKFLPTFQEYEIEAIDEAEDEKDKLKIWAVVDEVKEKQTKTGSPFLIVRASGITEKPYNFRVWNTSMSETDVWKEGKILVFSIEYSEDYGYSVPRNSKVMVVNK